MTYTSKIISTGSYLPEKILTNTDLTKIVDTSDEWISQRTGIQKRHIAAEYQLTSDLAFEASKKALAKANVSGEDIDIIIVATTTADNSFPSTAAKLQAKLGNKKALTFDIQAVCAGFVYAVSIADSMLKTGKYARALIVGAEIMSRLVNWEDRTTCVLFGDGAGAVLLERKNLSETNSGVIDFDLHSDGSLANILYTDGGIALSRTSGSIIMNGKEVFKHAIEKMSDSVGKLLEKNKLSSEDINLFIPHQANIRILEGVAKKLSLPLEKMILTVDQHANTSAASIPLAMDFANQNGKIKEGDLIVIEALGGGLVWGSCLIKW